MIKRAFFVVVALAILMYGMWGFSDTSNDEDHLTEKVKIAIREVGNQLLLAHQDTTSLILPVRKLGTSKYELSFEEHLSFEPDILVSVMAESFRKADLPVNYRVEVVQCSDGEIAYSYEINAAKEKTIIPCAGRFLPNKCYTIEVRFLDGSSVIFNSKTGLYVLAFSVLLFVVFSKRKRKQAVVSQEKYDGHTILGSFRFYPDQHKLVKEAIEIGLSKKECELLEIFIAQPNQVVTRDELTKKVWEDNGVFVGRSLDTYISKLRKKLSEDKTLKLTNIHGVGYKLEIDIYSK